MNFKDYLTESDALNEKTYKISSYDDLKPINISPRMGGTGDEPHLLIEQDNDMLEVDPNMARFLSKILAKWIKEQ